MVETDLVPTTGILMKDHRDALFAPAGRSVNPVATPVDSQ
jgi:hypothetical protein